jgi:hypothetical protein
MKNLTIIFILIANLCFSQTRTESAKKLNGKVHVMVVFSSNYNDEWRDFEKNEKLKLVEENMRWLQKEASKYNQTFSFEVKKYGGDYDEEIEYDGTDVLLVEKGIHNIVKTVVHETHNTPQELYKSIGANNLICIVFHKDDGRAFANPTYMSNYFLEYCVIYEHHRNGVSCANSVVSHEILHLFGAIDLYLDNIDLNFKNLVNKYCKDDIMSKTGDLRGLKITEFTAYKLNWTTEYKNYFSDILVFK